jgi:hypothetical protein
MATAHIPYEAGDRIRDLTFDPAPFGTVTKAHESRENAYYVRLDGGSNDVVIHARNMKLAGSAP